MCIKDNKELHKKLDAFDPSKIVEVVAQAVAGGYPKSSHKPYTYQKQQASQGSNPFSKPYLGPPREPQVTPGADGSLNPSTQLQVLQGYRSRRVQLRQSKKERGSQGCRCFTTVKHCQ